MRRPLLLASTVALAVLGPAVSAAGAASGFTLVQLRAAAACSGAAPLAAAGATPVARELRLWRLPSAEAERVLPALRSRGAVRLAEPDRPLAAIDAVAGARLDPLSGEEWWRAAVHVEGLTPPGPGVAVTIVDSGIDVSHPEFAGRPNTVVLNQQEPVGIGGEHGTAVASLVAAPENGVGMVGIYPQVLLASWDAARGAGTRLDTSEIVGGIVAAARRAPGVINLSLGGTEKDILVQQAVGFAIAKGSLVVAASGNDGEVGSPLGYPAVLPHVLTVAATDRNDNVASFSSRSPYVDLAAPGTNITVATALGRAWRPSAGTSFSAPLVSGAAAWVWTTRPELDWSQVFEVVRRSARDLGTAGRDTASGFGMLDVGAALTFAAPIRDLLEPNEDVDYIDAEGLYAAGVAPLTTRARPTASVAARVGGVEDPRDVYRVYLPRGGRLVVTANADADVELALWRKGTQSVVQRFASRDRLARAATQGQREMLRYRNAAPGRIAWLAVIPRRGTEGAYRLTVRVR
jgi:subtilisin family serine protease